MTTSGTYVPPKSQIAPSTATVSAIAPPTTKLPLAPKSQQVSTTGIYLPPGSGGMSKGADHSITV